MTTKIKVLLIAFLAIAQLGCKKQPLSTQQANTIEVLTPEQFKDKSEGQTIIDIRTPQEYAQGHIEEAVNINYFDNQFLDKVSKFDKSKPVFIYCRSGNRTSSASRKLAKAGFEKVYDLQNGILNWTRNKQKIVK